MWSSIFALFSFFALASSAQGFSAFNLMERDLHAREQVNPRSESGSATAMTISTPLSTTFSFEANSRLTTCSSGTVHWRYSGPATSMTLTLSGINDLQPLPPGVPVLPIILSDAVDSSSGSFIWSQVNVPEGWYMLNIAIPLLPEEKHHLLFVHRGRDTSCLRDEPSEIKFTQNAEFGYISHDLQPRSTPEAAGVPILIVEIVGVVLLVVTAMYLFWRWEVRKKNHKRQDVEDPNIAGVEQREGAETLDDFQILERKSTYQSLHHASKDGQNGHNGSTDTEQITPHGPSILPSSSILNYLHESKTSPMRCNADGLSIPESAMLSIETKRQSVISLANSTAPSRLSGTMSSILSITTERYYTSHFSATLGDYNDRRMRHASSLSVSTHNIQPSRASSISSSKNIHWGSIGGGTARRVHRKSTLPVSPEVCPPLPVHHPSNGMLLPGQKALNLSTDSLRTEVMVIGQKPATADSLPSPDVKGEELDSDTRG